MARKMKTMDGNQAAFPLLMRLRMLPLSIPLPLHLLWQNIQTNGRPTED